MGGGGGGCKVLSTINKVSQFAPKTYFSSERQSIILGGDKVSSTINKVLKFLQGLPSGHTKHFFLVKGKVF